MASTAAMSLIVFFCLMSYIRPACNMWTLLFGNSTNCSKKKNGGVDSCAYRCMQGQGGEGLKPTNDLVHGFLLIARSLKQVKLAAG